MPAPACLLQKLRRSVLGAWFAAAYALAVLALTLAPSPSLAFGLPGGILLCSGVPAPDDGGTGGPAAPLGELTHCKGCPHNPTPATPPAQAAFLVVRSAVYLAPSPRQDDRWLPLAATGLPPSRGPPRA